MDRFQPLMFGEDTEVALTEEDLTLVESVLDEEVCLSESRTIVRFSRQDRLKTLIGSSSIALARQANDKLYTDYAKAFKRVRALRDRIRKKYRSKATTTARELMRNIGKGKENKGLRDAGSSPDK